MDLEIARLVGRIGSGERTNQFQNHASWVRTPPRWSDTVSTG